MMAVASTITGGQESCARVDVLGVNVYACLPIQWPQIKCLASFFFFLCVCVWGYVYVTIGQPHLVHVTVAEHSD